LSTLILEVSEISLQVIFGIPQYLIVSANKPANIYYTLDGSDPKDTESSLLAGSKIYLPTDQPSFTFKCVAFDSSTYSDIFTKQYSASNASISNTRKGNESGVVVVKYDDDIVDSFGYDEDGVAAQTMSKVRHSFDFVTSRTNYIGESVPNGTSKDFINFAKSNMSGNDEQISSPNNDNVNFNPKAKIIIISGKTQEEMNDQSVMLVNRPYNNFDYDSKFYTDNDSKFKSIISGNLVNYVYNRSTGEITFYYYESVESRWIISKQKVAPKELRFSSAKYGRKNRMVFEWIQDPVMSKLR